MGITSFLSRGGRTIPLSELEGQLDDDGIGSGGSQPFLVTSPIVLTHAQIQALGTATGVDLGVAEPGPGKILSPLTAFLTCDATAAAYSPLDASANLYVGWVGGSQVNLLALLAAGGNLAAFFGGNGEKTFCTMPAEIFVSPGITAAELDASECENRRLEISGWNNGVNFPGGNAANTMTVEVVYRITTLS